jgi:hypothetical protein
MLTIDLGHNSKFQLQKLDNDKIRFSIFAKDGSKLIINSADLNSEQIEQTKAFLADVNQSIEKQTNINETESENI